MSQIMLAIYVYLFITKFYALYVNVSTYLLYYVMHLFNFQKGDVFVKLITLI